MSDDLVKRLQLEIYAIMGPEGADYSVEPVSFYMEAADALLAKDAEIARLRGLIGRYGLNVGDAEGIDFTDGPHLTPQETVEVMELIDIAETARAAINPQHKKGTL